MTPADSLQLLLSADDTRSYFVHVEAKRHVGQDPQHRFDISILPGFRDRHPELVEDCSLIRGDTLEQATRLALEKLHQERTRGGILGNRFRRT